MDVTSRSSEGSTQRTYETVEIFASVCTMTVMDNERCLESDGKARYAHLYLRYATVPIPVPVAGNCSISRWLYNCVFLSLVHFHVNPLWQVTGEFSNLLSKMLRKKRRQLWYIKPRGTYTIHVVNW